MERYRFTLSDNLLNFPSSTITNIDFIYIRLFIYWFDNKLSKKSHPPGYTCFMFRNSKNLFHYICQFLIHDMIIILKLPYFFIYRNYHKKFKNLLLYARKNCCKGQRYWLEIGMNQGEAVNSLENVWGLFICGTIGE